MKNYYVNLDRANGVKIKPLRRGIRIDVQHNNKRNKIDPNQTYRKLQEQIKNARKFRFRHLKLGPRYLFSYFLTSISLVRDFDGTRIPTLSNEKSWDTRKITFTTAVTVHNQSKTELYRCIKSILRQSRLPDFVLVLDDGSTRKETLKTLKEIAGENPELKFFRTKNQGVVKARNFLITQCKTSHLVFIDPDDEMDSEYLQSAEQFFKNDRSVEIVYPDVLVRTEKQEKLWVTGPFDPKILQVVNTIPMSSICATSVFRDLEGYSEEFNRGYEDWDFWLRAALSGVRAAPLKSVGYFYSEKLHSRSSDAKKHDNELIHLIRDRAFGKQMVSASSGQVEIFIFAPWFIRGGGVDALIERLINKFRHQKVALVTTEIKPEGYISAITTELEKSVPVIERMKFSNDEDFLRILKKSASKKAVLINMGSPWAFDNSIQLSSFINHHFAWAFNDIGTSRIIDCPGPITEAWPVYAGLKREIQSVKDCKIPVELLYIGIQQKRRRVSGQIRSRKLKVGWMGRLSPEKDPIKFLEIAYNFSGSKFHFSMAGDGPLRSKVLSKLKDDKRVKYFGYVESSTDYLQNQDILVLTSKMEGIPLVAMEALQLGVYVVAPNIGGLPDLINDTKNGILYDGSKKDLFRALNEARTLILSRKSSPTLPKVFLEKSMFAQIISRISHYHRSS